MTQCSLSTGSPVISLKSLIEMKQRLGREKDRRDIRLIAVFLAKQNRVSKDNPADPVLLLN